MAVACRVSVRAAECGSAWLWWVAERGVRIRTGSGGNDEGWLSNGPAGRRR